MTRSGTRPVTRSCRSSPTGSPPVSATTWWPGSAATSSPPCSSARTAGPMRNGGAQPSQRSRRRSPSRCPQAVTGSSAPQTVEITLLPMARDTSTDSLTPTCHPHQRDPADVEPASTYQRDDPVWVYREGAWRPGVVESASAWAVMATYRYAGGTGTVVDTMAAEYVLARTTGDAQLDRKDSPVRDNRVTRAAALAS